nr:PREDICTED: ring finger protein 26-like [Bemisia tabaci]
MANAPQQGEAPAQNRNENDGPLMRDMRCIVCLDREREIMFLPCRHFAVCEPCNEVLIRQVPPMQDQRCPTCREPVIDAVRVFVA